jgi:hypothetical protein
MLTPLRSLRRARRRPSRLNLVPSVESFEQRTLLAANIGFIQGFAYVDKNNDNTFDTGDRAKVNETIDLYASNGKTLLASTRTDASGYYQFNGLAPGTYKLVEVDPDKLATGTQADMTLDQATQVANNAVSVTIAASTSESLNVARQPGLDGAVAGFTVTDGPFNDLTAPGDTVHQYQLELSGGGLSSPITIYSFCTDLFRANPANYTVTPSASPAPSSPISTYNAGEIAYLYSKFGTQLLSPTQGAGLQLAIWALEYNSGGGLSGAFQVTAPGAGSPTDASAYAAAQAYLADAQGKSADAYFLEDSGAVGSYGMQSMITTESINFANRAPSHGPGCGHGSGGDHGGGKGGCEGGSGSNGGDCHGGSDHSHGSQGCNNNGGDHNGGGCDNNGGGSSQGGGSSGGHGSSCGNGDNGGSKGSSCGSSEKGGSGGHRGCS